MTGDQRRRLYGVGKLLILGQKNLRFLYIYRAISR